MKAIAAILFILTCIWELAFSVQLFPELRVAYPPAAALFGPKHNFICNAVIIGKGRVLTTADCLRFTQNGSYEFGQPQDFHVAMETHNIEMFENGKAFTVPSSQKFLSKLLRKRLPKYDNKYSNDIFSNRFGDKELKFLMKSLRANDFGPKWSNYYVSVRNFTIHPHFQGNFSNDLAILEVSSTHPFSNTSLVAEYFLDIGSSYNRRVNVHGWGVLSTGTNEENRTTYFKIRTIEMLLASPTVCERIVGRYFDSNQHLCLMPVTNETLCFGFTGAPIVLDNKLVGVVEFGEATCSPQSPVVGIRIGAFRRFLGISSTNLFARIREAMRSMLRPIVGAVANAKSMFAM